MTAVRSGKPSILMPPVLVLSRVTKLYRRRAVTALSEISLSVDAGTRLAIVGPSGSGKSTLLNLMGGLDTPTSGSVSFNGHAISSLGERARSILRRDSIGYVFQAYHLLPTLTCEENVALPLFLRNESESAARARARDVLERVGLADRCAHLPDELSGGERQRAAIARAIVGHPSLLLADEPTGNLDGSSADQVLHVLCDVAAERQATLIVVTHSQAVVARCERAVRLDKGRLIESGTAR